MRRIKKHLPAPLQAILRDIGQGVKFIQAYVQGLKDGPRPPLVPPRHHIFIGGGDFVLTGERFLDVLKAAGLTPDMDILDPGCGQGRMARPLTAFLSSNGSYSGFDIHKRGIEWCQDAYKAHPNFSFHHADVYNKRYNKTGKVDGNAYTFPYDDNSFDFVFLTSVFTHMFADDIRQYLSEIQRVLRPGGRCLITWFLLEDGIETDTSKRDLDFYHSVDKLSKTTVPDMPEAAIAFDQAWVETLYADLGLSIATIKPGRWSNPSHDDDYQDIIIADKNT